MVKKGYKQTEVGVIPEDWSVSALEKLYNITSSKRVFQSQWRKSGVPFYRAREIAVMSEGKIAPEDLYIDESLYNQYIHQYGSINKNDILITGVGTLGKVYVVKENDRFYFKDGNIIWLQAKHDFSSIYLKYQYDMPALINQVFGNAGGSTVATYTITNAKTTKVPVPPLPEQQRIAEALSDVDGMISSLEKLIAKYKSIKTACLQQMFPQNGETVPRMRLPGFTDAWEQRKFEEFAVRSSVICSDVNLPRVEYEDIVSGAGRLNKDIYAKQRSKSGIAFHQGDVLYGKLRPYLQNWLLPTFDGLAVGDFWVLQPQNADSSFLYRLIQSRQFDEVANQSTGTKMPRADWKLVSKTVFSIPSNISEQAAIGTYFTALDSLITLHQRKLEKVQKIKQGMMQQLLTGKIRLV